jgi:hypothetical protein
MTNKIRSLGVLLILPLLSVSAVVAAFVDIPSANALTKRDYYALNDQHLTAKYGNSPVCGDHLCTAGEYMKMQQQLSQVQSEKISTTMTMQGHSMMSGNGTSMPKSTDM